MTRPSYKSALIVGAGPGLSASLARLLVRNGMSVALAGRNPAKLQTLCAETGATAHTCDAQDERQVARLFDALDQRQGPPDVVIYNASARARGPLTTLDPDAIADTYLHVLMQSRSAWTWEVELRPWVERF
jgi:NADP-dependent 3-hydroxy acid dehydrogenase YdfG